MTPAQGRQPRKEVGRRDDEPALALDRLDDGGGDRCRIHHRHERSLDRLQGELAGLAGVGAPVRVGVRQPVHLGRERPEPGLVRMVPARERHREERPTVEPALEAKERRPAGRGSGELDGVLDGLGARIEQGHLAFPTARGTNQPFGQLHVRLVGDDGEVRVRDAGRLPVHRLDHLGMGVADQLASQAPREVQERVPVDIGDASSMAVVDDDRSVEVEGIGDDTGLPLEDGGGTRTRKIRDEGDGPAHGPPSVQDGMAARHPRLTMSECSLSIE